MSIKDKNIPWKLKREYIPVHMMAGLLEAAARGCPVQISLAPEVEKVLEFY